MKEPTQEQIKEFWEWCGLTHRKMKGGFNYWYNATGLLESIFTPPIDLNNLFKYAMPKLYNWDLTKSGLTITASVSLALGDTHYQVNPDPTLALFWAIYKVIKEE